MKKNLKEKIKETQTNLNIELLYLRNKHKGIDKDFIIFLIEQKQDEALKLINKAKNKQDLHRLLKEHYKELAKQNKYIYTSLLTGNIFDTYDGDIHFIPIHVAEVFMNHDYQKQELEEILKQYASSLIEYLNNHNSLKHELVKKKDVNGVMIADFRNNFTIEDYNIICTELFKVTSDVEEYNRKQIMAKLIFKLLTVYPKDILLYNTDFVKYELESGYFDEYYKLIEENKELPSLEERQSRFLNEREITPEQRYRLSQIDLLEKRVASLTSPTKELILEKIKLIKKEPDIKKKVIQIDSCFEYYENKYREEIVASLFTPTSSKEITDFREAETLMLHIFLRNPERKLSTYETQLKQEILEARGVKVTGTEELTEEEKAIFQSKIQYAIDVLLNPVITSESLNTESCYSDSMGLRWYISNTSDQISTSVMTIESITNMSNCVGIGFDQTSISPKNIIISSPYYQTTNMGVDNLEVDPRNKFKAFSAPLSELKKANKTELVLYRNKDNIKTESSYVFAIINGYISEQDEKTLKEAQQYAEKNNKKLIVFNNKKIRQSYEDYIASHTKDEPQSEEIKKK